MNESDASITEKRKRVGVGSLQADDVGLSDWEQCATQVSLFLSDGSDVSEEGSESE